MSVIKLRTPLPGPNSAGMPLGAVTGRAEIMDSPHYGGVGSTFGGNPLACAAALKTIEVMARDNLNQRAEQIGEVMLAHYRAWQARYPIIGDVRGLGAMTALEFVKGRDDRTPNVDVPLKVVGEAYKRGLLLIRAGIYSNCVRTLPPLSIGDAELEEGLGVLEQAIATVA
jgi:4-aminobutyrate aminotransferase/(S)-3-amino-2-methylpropionate transaminase